MNKHNQLKFTVFAALLTSISVVLKLFLGITVDMFGGLVKDINLSPTTIMFSGMMLGPVYGGLVGALTDILVYIVRPLGSYNPIFTITNALMGILPALFFLKSQKHSLLRISLSTAFTQILCSFIINTLTLIFDWIFTCTNCLVQSLIHLYHAAHPYFSDLYACKSFRSLFAFLKN